MSTHERSSMYRQSFETVMVNLRNFSFCSQIKCWLIGWNSQKACQNSKQGDLDQTASSAVFV